MRSAIASSLTGGDIGPAGLRGRMSFTAPSLRLDPPPRRVLALQTNGEAQKTDGWNTIRRGRVRVSATRGLPLLRLPPRAGRARRRRATKDRAAPALPPGAWAGGPGGRSRRTIVLPTRSRRKRIHFASGARTGSARSRAPRWTRPSAATARRRGLALHERRKSRRRSPLSYSPKGGDVALRDATLD